MGHRYYDTRIGRFITQDPAGDGDNWYAYAGNNPVNDIDPSGLSTPLYHNLGGDFADGTGQMGIGSGEGSGFWQRDRNGETTTWHWEDGNHNRLSPDAESTVWGPWSDWHFIPQDNGFEMGTGRVGRFAADSSLDGTPADIQLTHELAAADDGTAGTLAQPKGWGKGTYESAKHCAEDHFKRKGGCVNARTLEQYLRKAEAFNQNLARSARSQLENGAMRFTKNGQYIIKDIENLIVSYGKARK